MTKIRAALVLKYRESVDSTLDTVEAHNDIFKKHGKVYIAKFGVPIIGYALLRLGDAVDLSLILLRRRGDALGIFQAHVEKMVTSRPPKELYPAYYRSLTQIGNWFCLNSSLNPIRQDELDKWVIATSGSPVASTLLHSTRTYVSAVYSKDLAQYQAVLKKAPKTVRVPAVRTPKLPSFDDSLIDPDSEDINL